MCAEPAALERAAAQAVITSQVSIRSRMDNPALNPATNSELEAWLRQYLKPLTDRIAQLDWQAALLHARLMVSERLTVQLTAVMTEPARVNALQQVRDSVQKELTFAEQSAGLEILAQHLRDQITHLDKSIETMRANLNPAG
jgi:predicted patatin/cPLA2 family phospholipase